MAMPLGRKGQKQVSNLHFEVVFCFILFSFFFSQISASNQNWLVKSFTVNSKLITVRITFVFNEVNLTAVAPAQGYSNK